jgi:hypothetical protein
MDSPPRHGHNMLMRLTPADLRARAAAFAAAWADARDERRDTQSFWNAFFAIFDVDRRRVAVFEQSVAKLAGARGFIDLFWPGELIVEQKSLGRDLLGARMQALDYTHNLPMHEMPKRILACDFRTWDLYDLDTRETVSFTLDDLPRHIHRFDFILGRQVRTFRDQDPVNIRAAELVGHLHDRLEASGYTGHDLEQFLVRIVFCLFADDTGIFEPKDLLHDILENTCRPDGQDTGTTLARAFQTLNTPEDRRQSTLGADLARLPYVNGALFAGGLTIPDFDAGMHAALLNACRFDWTPISPAIFGSLFQSVMDARERRAKGAHYTTEKNILKVIEPLFLDDLRADFTAACARRTGRAAALRALHDRIASLTFFDPACGCGNFLIIAYRELRRLELDILKALRDDGQRELDARALSRVDVDQFYGIEIEEFPARIAETALWMMDHLMNRELSEAFGNVFVRIPLKKSPHIVHADALDVDWATVLPPERCSYIMGNPPFVGFVFRSQEQKLQFDRVLREHGVTGSRIDYVLAWFLKASAYARTGGARIGLVSTNSISQGEQVAQVWPAILERYRMVISFAHRTFAWGSDARGKAHVHVIVVGLDRAEDAPASRRLFSYGQVSGDPVETRHTAISPYLIDAGALANPALVVRRASAPMNGLPPIRVGTKPVDGGHYLFDRVEHEQFLAIEPDAHTLFRPFLGARELLQGDQRWILWVTDTPPELLARLPHVRKRVAAVRQFRASASGSLSNELANRPTEFHVTLAPKNPYVAIPEVSSERREHLPIAWLAAPFVPSNKLLVAQDATRAVFALLSSRAHVEWLRCFGGKLKSDFQYSPGLVYNTFPLPPGGDLSTLDPLAQAILDARAEHPGATLATLYDPDLMPVNLRRAHTALDRAVDRLYRRAPFASDRERVEHLFALYERLAAPLLPPAPKRRKTPRTPR